MSSFLSSGLISFPRFGLLQKRKTIVAAASLSALSALAGSARAAVTYSVQDLGVVGTDVGSFGYGISSSGVVAGESDSNSGSQGAFSKSGALVGLGTFGGSTGTAAAINSGGTIVGGASNSSNIIIAYTANTGVATPTLSPLPLNNAAGYPTITSSSATGINTAGTVIGQYSSAASPSLAFQWSPGSTTLTPLDPIGKTGLGGNSLGGATSFASGINTGGLIVGQATDTAGDLHGFLYSGSKMYDIGTNGASAGSTSSANAINDKGVIVGNITDASTSEPAAFSYTGYNTAATTDDTQLEGVFTPLDPTGIYAATNALAINSSGDIVGNAQDMDSNPVGFLYVPGVGIESIDSMIDPSSGIDVQYATGINDAGQIVGYGTVPGGAVDALLLTPETSVPEPALLGLTGISMVGLLVRRRRQGGR